MDGNRKAQEAYGSLGFMEFTPFPDIVRSDQGLDPEQVLNDLVPEALALPVSERPAAPARASDEPLPTVDVTVRITEGEQFLINRIAFSGNTTTRDHVIRRELGGLLEGAPFNTEALKFAVRRVNQLGYFKPLEGNESDVQVDKTPGRTNAVGPDHRADALVAVSASRRDHGPIPRGLWPRRPVDGRRPGPHGGALWRDCLVVAWPPQDRRAHCRSALRGQSGSDPDDRRRTRARGRRRPDSRQYRA
jgi:hypothetical protein